MDISPQIDHKDPFKLRAGRAAYTELESTKPEGYLPSSCVRTQQQHDFHIDNGLTTSLQSAAEAINLLKNTQDMSATSRLPLNTIV